MACIYIISDYCRMFVFLGTLPDPLRWGTVSERKGYLRPRQFVEKCRGGVCRGQRLLVLLLQVLVLSSSF